VSGGIKKTLTNLGCNVIGPVTSVVASLAALDRERVNLALIDSTSSDMRLPIADALVEKRIPFAYISGRGLEMVRCTRHANVPVLFKPFTPVELEILVRQLADYTAPLARERS
jgi:hypothetical protein